LKKVRHISAKVLDIPKISPKIFPKRARKWNDILLKKSDIPQGKTIIPLKNRNFPLKEYDISIKRVYIPIIKTKKYNIH